jgi:hypothetical protein
LRPAIVRVHAPTFCWKSVGSNAVHRSPRIASEEARVRVHVRVVERRVEQPDAGHHDARAGRGQRSARLELLRPMTTRHSVREADGRHGGERGRTRFRNREETTQPVEEDRARRHPCHERGQAQRDRAAREEQREERNPASSKAIPSATDGSGQIRSTPLISIQSSATPSPSPGASDRKRSISGPLTSPRVLS